MAKSRIHASDESVDPSEIERLIVAQALLIENLADSAKADWHRLDRVGRAVCSSVMAGSWRGSRFGVGRWHPGRPVGRRVVLRALLPTAAVPGGLLAACTPPRPSDPPAEMDPAARLTARPVTSSGTQPPIVPGRHALDLGPGPELLLHVPANASGAQPPRLVLCLHGAGQNPRDGLAPLLALAQAHRLLLLAPASHGVTWDAVADRWGQDVRHIDRALAAVLATHPVDPQHLAISGFSDGASYALSLGLANADLFTHIIAFSPGSLLNGPRVGTPRVFVSYGLRDEILPIDDSTRRIVGQLDADRVPTQVRIFDGPHTVPADIAQAAIQCYSPNASCLSPSNTALAPCGHPERH